MAQVHRIKKTPEQKEALKKRVTPDKPVSDEAMAQLARIMNDSPSVIKLHGTPWQITGLKPAVQMLIAEEACNVVKNENMSMGDVLKNFSTNLASVAKCLALAMLNSKERIYADYGQKVYSQEYHDIMDVLMWGDYDMRDWAQLLYEVLSLIKTDFFFQATSVIKTVREMTLERKTTKAERG